MTLLNIHRLIRDLDALGIPLPEPVAAVQATRHAINSLALTPPTASFEDDLAAGKITAANAEKRVRQAATELLAHEKAVQVSRDAEPILVRLERRALAVSGDTIIEALRTSFDPAAAALSTFVNRFGADPQPEAVLSAPGGSDLWQARGESLAFFDRCRRICSDLSGIYWDTEAPSWYLASVTDAEHLSAARNVFTYSARGFADLLAAGYKLRLNTNAEAVALVNGAKAEKVRREEAAAKAKADEQAAHKARLAAERAEYDKQPAEMRKRLAS